MAPSTRGPRTPSSWIWVDGAPLPQQGWHRVFRRESSQLLGRVRGQAPPSGPGWALPVLPVGLTHPVWGPDSVPALPLPATPDSASQCQQICGSQTQASSVLTADPAPLCPDPWSQAAFHALRVRVLSRSVVSRLFATPWTVAHRLLCLWDSPGKKTRVGCHALLQGIFLTQRSNPSLLHLLRWHVGS